MHVVDCGTKLGDDQLRSLFDGFWEIGDYEKQNHHLAGLMISMDLKTRKTHPLRRNRDATWRYVVKLRAANTVVCRKFLINVLNNGKKRIRVLQLKLLDNAVIRDRRGRHVHRAHKIDPQVWVLLNMLSELLPHAESHYCLRTIRKYFRNPL